MPPPIVESLDKARLRLGGLGYHDEARDMASAMSQANKMLDALKAVAACPQAAPWLEKLDGTYTAVKNAIAHAEGRFNG